MADDKTQLTPVDLSFLQNFSDMVRDRNLFFVPIFCVFVALLVTQSDYVLKMNIVDQILIFITFLSGVLYINIAVNYLRTLQMLRFMYGRDAFGQPNSQGVFDAVLAMGKTVGPNFKLEEKAFRWTMRLFWVMTGVVLLNMYFHKPIDYIITVLRFGILRLFGVS
jgi:hypothetical protein